jgi:hypothetical protein
MGIRQILAAIRARVPQIALKTQPSRRIIVSDLGTDATPEDWIASPYRDTRSAMIGVAEWPTFYGSPCHNVAVLALQVVYRHDQAESETLAMMLEDHTLLIHGICTAPATWGAGAQQIWHAPPSSHEVITDANGKRATTVVTIPLSVIWSE